MVSDPATFWYALAELDAAIVTNSGSGSDQLTELAFTRHMAGERLLWKLRFVSQFFLILSQNPHFYDYHNHVEEHLWAQSLHDKK